MMEQLLKTWHEYLKDPRWQFYTDDEQPNFENFMLWCEWKVKNGEPVRLPKNLP